MNSNAMEDCESQTIWCEKYRASSFTDLIIPKRLFSYFANVLEHPMQFPNMMFYSHGPGSMKTTTAEVLAKEMRHRYKSQYKKINASQDGNKETIKDEIIEWGSYSGFSKFPNIVILDEVDKCNPKVFLDPLLSTIESLNKSTRFILTSNNLQNFSKYAESRIEVFDFSMQNKEEDVEVMKSLYARIQQICELEKVKYDLDTIKFLIKKYHPDIRSIMTRLYSHYLQNGGITGSYHHNKQDDDKYLKLFDSLMNRDFASARSEYAKISSSSDIFIATMNGLVTRIQDPMKQMKAVCAIRNHMVSHNNVIDREINIASMFASLILVLDE